jgi:hypothetical protein
MRSAAGSVSHGGSVGGSNPACILKQSAQRITFAFSDQARINRQHDTRKCIGAVSYCLFNARTTGRRRDYLGASIGHSNKRGVRSLHMCQQGGKHSTGRNGPEIDTAPRRAIKSSTSNEHADHARSNGKRAWLRAQIHMVAAVNVPLRATQINKDGRCTVEHQPCPPPRTKAT